MYRCAPELVQALRTPVQGTKYTAALVWKANTPMPSGDQISIGAGPINFAFSPTALLVDLGC